MKKFKELSKVPQTNGAYIAVFKGPISSEFITVGKSNKNVAYRISQDVSNYPICKLSKVVVFDGEHEVSLVRRYLRKVNKDSKIRAHDGSGTIYQEKFNNIKNILKNDLALDLLKDLNKSKKKIKKLKSKKLAKYRELTVNCIETFIPKEGLVTPVNNTAEEYGEISFDMFKSIVKNVLMSITYRLEKVNLVRISDVYHRFYKRLRDNYNIDVYVRRAARKLSNYISAINESEYSTAIQNLKEIFLEVGGEESMFVNTVKRTILEN